MQTVEVTILVYLLCVCEREMGSEGKDAKNKEKKDREEEYSLRGKEQFLFLPSYPVSVFHEEGEVVRTLFWATT